LNITAAVRIARRLVLAENLFERAKISLIAMVFVKTEQSGILRAMALSGF